MTSNDQSQVLQTLLSTKVGKLYGLQDISTTRSWDYSLPTISHRGFTDRADFKFDKSFFDIFKDRVNGGLPYRILKSEGVFDEDNDIVLFGGCLLDVIMKRPSSIKDFDLRLVGDAYVNDETKCVARAKEFVASVFSFLVTENKKIDEEYKAAKNAVQHGDFYPRKPEKCNVHEVTVSRSRSTVTVRVPPVANLSECIFQLTFSPSKNVKEMLASCQPHCTRLAIKDGTVVMDHMARYCIESTCIPLDAPSFVNLYCGDADDEDEQAKRTTSGRTIAFQLTRYIRHYEEKGFDIILPELDMTKVPRRNLAYNVPEVLALPSLTVIYNSVYKNQIMATKLDLPKNLWHKVPASGLVGGYDSRPAENVGVVVHHNIRCLVNDVYDSFKFVAKGERWDHVFDFAPSLTPRMVRKSYETVMTGITCEPGMVPISNLAGYFSVTSPDEVVEKLIMKPLRDRVVERA